MKMLFKKRVFPLVAAILTMALFFTACEGNDITEIIEPQEAVTFRADEGGDVITNVTYQVGGTTLTVSQLDWYSAYEEDYLYTLSKQLPEQTVELDYATESGGDDGDYFDVTSAFKVQPGTEIQFQCTSPETGITTEFIAYRSGRQFQKVFLTGSQASNITDHLTVRRGEAYIIFRAEKSEYSDHYYRVPGGICFYAE